MAATPTQLTQDHLDEPITRHVRTDFLVLNKDRTIQEAADTIRRHGGGDNFAYFYVVNDDQQLVGVLPTRKLLTTALDRRIETVMRERVVAIPDSFTVLEACEFFALHRFLAFPVVDSKQHVVGLVDINLFESEMFDIQEREQMDSLFETLGFRLSQVRDNSIWSGFRARFPWLLATIASGTLCAVLVSLFEVTLARSLVLAFFLTLVLGLGESVSVQTMTIVIHALRQETPGWRWYVRSLRRELARVFTVGIACAAIVGAIVIAWQREPAAGLVIAGGILGSLLAACFLGVSIPTLLHRLKLDLKIASGPLTLALTDVCTIVTYFTLATLVLAR
jgi:magnesium transporter